MRSINRVVERRDRNDSRPFFSAAKCSFSFPRLQPPCRHASRSYMMVHKRYTVKKKSWTCPSSLCRKFPYPCVFREIQSIARSLTH
ncbi:hypothetical protein ONE63_003349 [Megalurothrips usitatus]|uniref:Uncharacterized protein n=1 Tax=Megalurothrips usitatus TaxID=439358 RepID=A0AAV7XDL0_9NEOP|nr:hypothetical protein ONE63_003349 [Megalurothrips usitatus]